MNKYFLILFSLFLFGCISETQPTIVEKIPECELNDLECFFNNIMNNHSSIVHFSSQTPIYDFHQFSKGYYRSNGCGEEICVFEVYYYENEIYLSHEMNQNLIDSGYTQEEINDEMMLIQNTLNENWEQNKVRCEMTRGETKIYLNEYLESKEGDMEFNEGNIGSKKCEIVSK
jgi:hypothetical protein